MTVSPLTPLEIASGVIVGGTPVTLPTLAAGVTPAEALIASIVPAAQRGPLFVSFSGGVDSSLVLAAAARAAASVGARPPIPLTWRPEDAPGAREDDWQEAVVRELRIDDWERRSVGDELDWVGPVARQVISRHGLLAPPNAHLHDPLLALASGGTLLTGIGGDQILGTWRWGRVAAIRAGTAPGPPRARLGAYAARLPLPVLAARERRRTTLASPWLTPRARQAAHRSARRDHVAEPQNWPERLSWQAGRRGLRLGLDGLDAMAVDHGAVVEHPLLAPAVLSALARAGGPPGFANRRATIAGCFADLVPEAVADRRTKAAFNEVFARGPSRAFIDGWDGSGVDATIVDAAALAELWAREVPMRTALLLQHIAIARTPAGGPEGPPASA